MANIRLKPDDFIILKRDKKLWQVTTRMKTGLKLVNPLNFKEKSFIRYGADIIQVKF